MNELQGDSSFPGSVSSTSCSSSGGGGGMTSVGSVRKVGSDNTLSPSAYAMSTSVERSAECVLAVLSTNSLTTCSVPNYARSISSPTGCTGSSTNLQSGSSSPTHIKRHSSHSGGTCGGRPSSRDENYSKSTSPTPSLRSCPAEMGRTSDSQGRDYKSSDSHSLQVSDGGILSDVRGGSGGSGGGRSNKSSPTGSQDEEEYFCEDTPSFSEDRSGADSIPDSFHTPSASIQNLSLNNNYNKSANIASDHGVHNNPSSFNVPKSNNGSNNGNGRSELPQHYQAQHHHHHQQQQQQQQQQLSSSGNTPRASVRSKGSNKSGSGSDSGNNGSDRVPGSYSSNGSSGAGNSNNANNSSSSSNNSANSASANSSSSSSNKNTDNAMTTSASSNKSDKETSPKSKRDSSGDKSSNAPSLKGSPELPHVSKTSNNGGNNGHQQELSSPTNIPLALEITPQAGESSASPKDSHHSGGSTGSVKEVYISPHYVPIKPNKKKMWYHVFTPSYKTRSNDFKKIFKELPSEERLIVDYSCALQKEILIQGRMYVSQNFISFHANIFGWETQTSIRLKDVTSITKEKTALVIPNAVQVSTDSERFFFTSFVSRDSTYVMLFKLWQSSLLEEVRNTIPTKEIWKLVHSCYGDELGVASEDDPEEFLACSPGALVNAPSVSTLISTSDPEDNKSLAESDSQVCASDLGSGVPISLGTVIGGRGGGESGGLLLPDAGALAVVGPITDLSDSSDSEGEVELAVPSIAPAEDDANYEIPICPVSHQLGRMVVDSIIPTDVDNLFTMLFTKSKFFQDLHTSRKTFDILQSDWHKSPDGSQNVRQVSFTVTLNHVMGPKHSQVTETQVMLPVSKPNVMYAIDSESVNAGIPYADSFYVTTHFCLTRHSAHETKLCIINQIKYRKSVFSMTKGFIERNTWAGLEEFYTSLERALKEECAKINANITAPPTPATARSGPTRRPGGRKKYPAPSAPPCASPNLVRASMSPNVSKSAIIPNGAIPRLMDSSTVSSGSQTQAEGSIVLKIILGILTCLLLLNAFLYVKLTRFESSKSQILFSTPAIAFPKNVPRNHQEWVTLLQQQEELHRLELQKWHEMLISALKTLHQAEEDLESLKFHITSYNTGRQSVNALKEAVDELHQSSLKHNNLYQTQENEGEDLNGHHENAESTNQESADVTASTVLQGAAEDNGETRTSQSSDREL